MILVILLVSCFFLTRGFISEKLAESLVCRETIEASDAVVIDNFDPRYLLFEATYELINSCLVGQVYIPVLLNGDGTGPDEVSQGFVEVMCRIAGINEYEMVLTKGMEPIRFNTVIQIKNHLKDKDINSIIVVSSGFSSKRAVLVYQSVFDSTGIKVSCLPVFNESNPSNWTESWHGIQDVFLEFGKLWYYRLVVL